MWPFKKKTKSFFVAYETETKDGGVLRGSFTLVVSNFSDINEVYKSAREEAKLSIDSTESHKGASFIIISFNEIPSE